MHKNPTEHNFLTYQKLFHRDPVGASDGHKPNRARFSNATARISSRKGGGVISGETVAEISIVDRVRQPSNPNLEQVRRKRHEYNAPISGCCVLAQP